MHLITNGCSYAEKTRSTFEGKQACNRKMFDVCYLSSQGNRVKGILSKYFISKPHYLRDINHYMEYTRCVQYKFETSAVSK